MKGLNRVERYKSYFEDITIPLNKGQVFAYGKFKNKMAVFDHSYISDKGDLIIVTDKGKEISASRIRLIQEDNMAITLEFYLQNSKMFVDYNGLTMPMLKFLDRREYPESEHIIDMIVKKIIFKYKDLPLVKYGMANREKKETILLNFITEYMGLNQNPLDVIIKGNQVIMNLEQQTESKFNEHLLKENLRFTDLMKKASLSPFTLDYNKETNKLMGPPTTHTKLKGMKVNKDKGYITFVWKTKRTPKYDKKSKMKVVDPKDEFKMKPARLYTIEIRILDFFNLLHTKPSGDFTNQDIEDVLNVCDIQVWSNVPAYEFQGMNYNMTLFDAAIYPEIRKPKVWNTIKSKHGKIHDENQFLDKHTAGVVNSIKFYIPQMRQMIKSYLKK